MSRVRVVGIVGPTATGKTALAMELAERLDAEIVSADARQIYRGFDIGTAKPSAAERARVPHHCLDLADPTERYDVGRYRSAARAAIADVLARGRRVLVVGGTGLYVRALLRGLCEGVPAQPALRDVLAGAEAKEPGLLARWAARLDPDAATRIHRNDRLRLLRVLEVALATLTTAATPMTMLNTVSVVRAGCKRIDRMPNRQITLGIASLPWQIPRDARSSTVRKCCRPGRRSGGSRGRLGRAWPDHECR
jgi:tRNA dimethylallyltransferase